MTCTICNSNEYTVAYHGPIRGGGIENILECANCSVQYLEKMREADYSKAYRDEVGPSDNRHLQNQIDYVDTENKVVLDVGCSDGTYLRSINAKQKIGVEPNIEQRKNSEFECFASIDDALEKYSGKIDIVTLWHVIEHVSNPSLFFQHLSKKTRIYGSTPNTKEILMFMPDFMKFYYRAWHTHYYTEESLFNLMYVNAFLFHIDYRHSLGFDNLIKWIGADFFFEQEINNRWQSILNDCDLADTLYFSTMKP